MLTWVAWIALILAVIALRDAHSVDKAAQSRDLAMGNAADNALKHAAESNATLKKEVEELRRELETFQKDFTDFMPVDVEILPLWGKILVDFGGCTEGDWSNGLEKLGLTIHESWRGVLRFTWISPSLVYRPESDRKFAKSPEMYAVAFKTSLDPMALGQHIALCIRPGFEFEMNLVTPASLKNSEAERYALPRFTGDEELRLATVPARVLRPWVVASQEEMNGAGWIEVNSDLRAGERSFKHKYFEVFTTSRVK